MKCCRNLRAFLPLILLHSLAGAAPVIDTLPNVNIPAGKSLTIPVTATSPNGRPLTYAITSSTNRITIEQHTNNLFWKMSVVQVAPANAPGAFQTPFRGGSAPVTNIGDMTFMLFRDRAPRTVDAIAALTSGGFYNSNTIFHRVVLSPYFIIQGGDPNTNGSGGPGFRYDDEIHPRSLYSGTGQLGAANSGPDTQGSQFFITATPQRGFDLRYTIFGQLLRGFNVLSNVLNTTTGANSRPLADVIITRASLVPSRTDTAITLTATNLAGVTGTISVIADDGTAGGRTTNSFTATTVSDAVNDPPILFPMTTTNLIAPMNTRITNYIATTDLEGSGFYWDVYFQDAPSFNAVSNYSFNPNGAQLIVEPKPGYVGPVRMYAAVSPDFFFSTYDIQEFTLSFGETAIVATPTNIVARPMVSFSNQTLATFTNGVPNSPTGNFTASINWGDNSTNSGVITTNQSGRKEVRSTHTYTNSGNYPVYVTIRGALGAETTVVTTAYVQPSISLTRTGTSNLLRWPAWAADFQAQSNTNLNTAHWTTMTNFSALVGYENVIINTTTATNQFFRLSR